MNRNRKKRYKHLKPLYERRCLKMIYRIMRIMRKALINKPIRLPGNPKQKKLQSINSFVFIKIRKPSFPTLNNFFKLINMLFLFLNNLFVDCL